MVSRDANADMLRAVAMARLLAANAAAADSPSRAHQLREAALAAITARPDSGADLRSAPIQALALLALNRVEDARPIVEHLAALGYKHPTLMSAWHRHAP